MRFNGKALVPAIIPAMRMLSRAFAIAQARVSRNLALLFLIPLLPALAVFCFHASRGTLPKLVSWMPEVSVKEAAGWENIIWVDARPKVEYEQAHKEGAIWLSEDQWQDGFPRLLDAWQPGYNVVVYCSSQSCQTSQAVARRVRTETAWNHVYVLQGGWGKLKDASLSKP